MIDTLKSLSKKVQSQPGADGCRVKPKKKPSKDMLYRKALVYYKWHIIVTQSGQNMQLHIVRLSYDSDLNNRDETKQHLLESFQTHQLKRSISLHMFVS